MAENEKPNHGKSRKRKAAKEKEANVSTTWTYDEKQKFVSGISIFHNFFWCWPYSKMF